MNYRLLIQYDGSKYDGWQRQKGSGITIQGKIEEVLKKMTGQPLQIKGASRTDAGVHAQGQVANVQMDTEKGPSEIRKYLNQYLPEDIAILEVSEVSERFHSRLNAGEKTYRYRICTSHIKPIFERKYVYDLNQQMDVNAMKIAAGYILGEHDFQSFCAKKMKKSTVREMVSIEFKELPGELQIVYKGSGFLYHMVRILTGTLIEVGLHERTPESVREVLAAKERAQAGYTAPAKGLCLLEIKY